MGACWNDTSATVRARNWKEQLLDQLIGHAPVPFEPRCGAGSDSEVVLLLLARGAAAPVEQGAVVVMQHPGHRRVAGEGLRGGGADGRALVEVAARRVRGVGGRPTGGAGGGPCRRGAGPAETRILARPASVAVVAIRVSARTLAYDIRPAANSAVMCGRLTRTCSRAVPGEPGTSMFQRVTPSGKMETSVSLCECLDRVSTKRTTW
jgi:hypothetical protein